MASEALRLEIASVAALDDPIRRRLYEYVVDQAEPVSRDMAASGVEVARHVAKFHLDRLEEEGLLEAEYRRPSVKTGPGAGRPTKYFRRSSREINVSIPERHYDLAARVLAQAITVSQTGEISIVDALEKTAVNFGQLMAQEVQSKLSGASNKTKVTDAISEVLDEHGYEPRREGGRLVLANCPFHSLATEYTTLICGINHNVIDALVSEFPSSFKADLEPTPGRCCVTLNEI
jgi:predicted ArsR family transcriptional regulator